MNEPRPDLVRCGCGVVRNDDDKPAPLAVSQLIAISGILIDPERYELPRVCRGCNGLYMLRRPQAPTVPK